MMFDKKILCLGNNDSATDTYTTQLANADNAVNHGLISDGNFIPQFPGYYHTTAIDLSSGAIINLAKHFDGIMLLDQPTDEWTHKKLLFSSYRIMSELESLGINTDYKNNKNIQKFLTFDQILKDNKSFCIYPWIEKINDFGNLTVCGRSTKKVTTVQELKDWRTDPEYQKIRQTMLRGEKLPNHCYTCYNYESKGIESYRIFETKDWISQLDINSIEDLDKITHPYYYEVRLSNKCNLMCRGCKPEHSNLIDREHKKFNIVFPGPQEFKYSSIDIIDIDTLGPTSRVYLTGGDPTVIKETYDFMEKCIKLGKTDFEFTLGTNGQKITKRFLDLCNHFTKMNFSISLDGYGIVNDYWRHGSEWNTVIQNTHLLESFGHSISINCVPGIYNVTNLHLLFEFLDREFPHCGLYLQINHVSIQSAYNHPNAKLVVESMEKCMKTNAYYTNGKSVKTSIDSIHAHYSKNPKYDQLALRAFFEYNDQLDQARNVRLADYIPELEECRKFI